MQHEQSPPSSPDRELSNLSEIMAGGLLRRALNRAMSPVESLITTLQSPCGHLAFQTLIDQEISEQVDDPTTFFLKADASLDELSRVKSSATSKAPKSQDPEEQVPFALLHLLATGAALAHHGEIITSIDPKQLLSTYEQLAEAAPDPWSGLFAKAAAALSRR